MRHARALGAAAFAAWLAVSTAAAAPESTFYRGKTVDLVVGYSPGGSYDLYARLVARFLSEFLPGKPNVVVRNMPGGGSRVAASYVARVAPQDGTVIGTADQALPLEQAISDKLLTFDTTKLHYVGSPMVENNTVVTWYKSGVTTIEDAKRREIPIGATGGNTTSSQYPKALNALVGTKFKIVAGYPGGNDINLAMERGEVMGRGSNAWDSWKATHPDWIRDGKINVLVQVGLAKAPDLAAPLMVDLATNEPDRAVLKLLSASTAIGRPLFVGPGVPPERVQELRDAFDAMAADARFRAAAAAQRLDVVPVSGATLQARVAEIAATPSAVGARLAAIIGGGTAAR